MMTGICSSEQQGAAESSREQQRAAGSSREQQGAAESSREQQRAAGSSREQQRAVGSSREQQGAAGRSREEEGAAGRSRGSRGQQGRAGSSGELAGGYILYVYIHLAHALCSCVLIHCIGNAACYLHARDNYIACTYIYFSMCLDIHYYID